MVHYELGFKLRHDCPFNRLSRKFPTAVVAWWSNFDQDVLEVTYGSSDAAGGYMDELIRIIGDMGGSIVRKTLASSKLQLVVNWDGTKWESSMSRVYVKHNCLVLHPTIHTDGWEWYRVVAFSERDMKALFRELDSSGEVEVISKKTAQAGNMRDNLVITTTNLVGGLTGKQTEALLLALDYGYYAVPKKATTEAVAARVGLPRTTFEEHLRKAESKVMLSVAPFVHLTAGKEND